MTMYLSRNCFFITDDRGRNCKLISVIIKKVFPIWTANIGAAAKFTSFFDCLTYGNNAR